MIAFSAIGMHVRASENPAEKTDQTSEMNAQVNPSVPVDKINLSHVKNQLVTSDALSYISEANPTEYVRITTYGVDCFGCYEAGGFGGTASGVALSFDAVKQSDGTWKEGITYDGYYIIAAHSSIPMGSIVEISNHGYTGMGLQAGVPFQAIVLDRGAMTLNHLDLFVGRESSPHVYEVGGYAPEMKVIRYGY